MITGNPENDFFDQNPELRYISEVKKIVQEFSKKEASQILWAIFLIEDPTSRLYRMPKEQRIEEVKKNYYNIDTDRFKELISIYPYLVLSKEQQMFKVHVDKLDELTSYLKNLVLSNPTEFDTSLKILEKLPKIWDGFDKVKRRMIEAEEKTNLRAGAVESAREKRKR